MLPVALLRPYCSAARRLLAAGDRAVVHKRVDAADIENFARLTGDHNPVHSGDRPVAHGVYLAGLVSAVIGTRLPGPGTVLVSKTMRFPNACRAGDLVRILVEVRSVRKIIKCEFRCSVGDKVVMEGSADVVVDRKGFTGDTPRRNDDET
ncbi:HotDog domain,MaoC-like domain [Cinara cedri]|uniref:HotDog domain,MaoC-like domain n=1 Tax=Cinara cedri TaxID=506608 RepID=A0A5E4N2E1_9HEMI|nr:HotDog domain,MaoC-like domain [Cinara cedri]